MPRASLEEQKSYPFSVDLRVRVSDLNYGAHLGYDRLLSMVQEARLRMFDRLSASELDLGDGRTGLLVVDVIAVYLGEAFLGDRLTFEICPVDIRQSSFRLAHRIACDEKNTRVALMEIGFTAFDYHRRRVASLPGRFRKGLAALAAKNSKLDDR